MIQEDPVTFNSFNDIDVLESPLITFRGRVLNKNVNFEIKSPQHGLKKRQAANLFFENNDDNNERFDTEDVQKCPINLNSININQSSFNNKFNSPRGKRISSSSSSPNPKSKIKAQSTAAYTSRLPVKQCRFSVKEFRLPPDNSLNLENESFLKVPTEKLIEELRKKVFERLKVDEYSEFNDDEEQEISNFVDETNLYNLSTPSIIQPRMSLRNRCPIIVDAPDLIYEDPLEVARQTIQNTRSNSGYRKVKLIYTTERRDNCRPNSPVPAFSKKQGISRHFIKTRPEFKSRIEGRSKTKTTEPVESETEYENEEINDKKRKLKFDRVLKFFEGDEVEESEGNLNESPLCSSSSLSPGQVPLKSCLKKSREQSQALLNSNLPTEPLISTDVVSNRLKSQTEVIQVKRICYDGEEVIPVRRIRLRSTNTSTKEREQHNMTRQRHVNNSTYKSNRNN